MRLRIRGCDRKVSEQLLTFLPETQLAEHLTLYSGSVLSWQQ